MASAFTHGFVAAALAPLAPRGVSRTRLTLVLVALSVLPDLDVIGLRLGIDYGHPLGPRGLTHSLAFALGIGLLAAGVYFPGERRFPARWLWLAALAVIVTASHGLLDALTNGGLGVGFFVPFDAERYFFDWRPLLVSPLSAGAFFSETGVRILVSEIRWVWLPTLALLGALLGLRRLLFRS